MSPGGRRDTVLLAVCGTTVGGALLTLGVLRPDDGASAFLALLGVAVVGWFVALHRVARGWRPSAGQLAACVALALAFRIPLLLTPPEPAADLRRYLWDAHLVRAGVSPYAVVPADPAAAPLRTPETWPLNNPDVPSPYPPGAQLFFLAATVAGESVLGVKLALLACDVLLALVVWRTLRARGENEAWLLAYAWNPLVALEVARHGHVDVVGALLVAATALALVRRRPLLASLAFACAVSVKPLPLVLLPLLWRRVALRHVAAGVAVLAALALPVWRLGVAPVGSIPDVLERFRFNGPVFSAVAAVTGPRAAGGVAVAAGLATALVLRRRMREEAPGPWAWPMAVALVAAPLVYPWYLLWVAPFLVGAATAPLRAWTASILLTYVVWRPNTGPWAVPGWALAIEYGVLLGALAWTGWRAARPRGDRAPAMSGAR